MADLVDTIREQIDARLDELRPFVHEVASLEAALKALDGSSAAVAASPRRRVSRRRVAASNDRGGGRRGQRREQLIEHLRANPGSTAGEVATALGLKRNTVATRLTQLAKAGQVSKAARGYSVP
jgi:predicted transcriptional regulator